MTSGGSSSWTRSTSGSRAGPQVALQPAADVGEIADALAQPVVAFAREHFVQLGDGALERPVGVDALGADELVGALA